MRTLKLQVQYVGTRYHGWQIQPDRPTIQGHLEAALSAVLNEPVRVAGAGRTDAGVHARGQVASLATSSTVPPRGILLGANSHLPGDIRIVSVEEAPRGFHARHHARSKDYAYRFSNTAVLSPFLTPTVQAVRGELDRARMGEAAAHFLGAHDFIAFCGAEGRDRDTRRDVTDSRLEEEAGGVQVYWISARSFLPYMVRTIAGTLLEVGRGRVRPEEIPGILRARDRSRSGPTAAARGLTLERVHYPDSCGTLGAVVA